RHSASTGVSLPVEVPIWVAAHGPVGYAVGARAATGVITNPTHGSRNPGLASGVRVFVTHYGTVLDEGEDLGSERVLHAAGPSAAFQLHIGGEGVAGGSRERAEYVEKL